MKTYRLFCSRSKLYARRTQFGLQFDTPADQIKFAATFSHADAIAESRLQSRAGYPVTLRPTT